MTAIQENSKDKETGRQQHKPSKNKNRNLKPSQLSRSLQSTECEYRTSQLILFTVRRTYLLAMAARLVLLQNFN